MKDRIPTKPGRVQLVPSADGDDLFVLTRSDEPTQPGTPLNKLNLLSDATVSAIGLPGDDPTVDDAFAFLAGNFSFTLSGVDAPTLETEAKRGDIYIQDAGTGPRRVYICNAVGVKDVDLGAKWDRGSLANNSATSADASYRVRSDVVLIPAGTKLSIASGFRFTLRVVNAAREYQSSVAFRTADWTASADTLARIMIARTTDDTSETADIPTFVAALSVTADGRHWTAVGSARQVEKTLEIRQSGVFRVPSDMTGTVKIMAFGGGAGGSSSESGYGGGGGHMATYSGVLTEKVYDVIIGAGGAAGSNGGTTTFGSLVTAAGATGQNGGSGGGSGKNTNAGNGSYGGGGGGHPSSTTAVPAKVGGNGGTYGGGGGGSSGGTGGSGQNKHTSTGTGGAGYSANTSSATGGAGANTTGLSLPFEGVGTGGTSGGGGGGYGGNGGNSNGGGGGYGANGGDGTNGSGGGGGGYGGNGGNGDYQLGGGGGGGYGKYSGNGGNAGQPGGTAAGGGCGAAGGSGIVVIAYTGWEVF